MREIKFRFYYKNKLLDTLSLGEISERGFHWADDVVVVEFTGLKDKQGKEIYEGDIVKHYNPANEGTHLPTTLGTGVIVYEFNGFHLAKFGGGSVPTVPERFEVIGNIYENPELVKEGK